MPEVRVSLSQEQIQAIDEAVIEGRVKDRQTALREGIELWLSRYERVATTPWEPIPNPGQPDESEEPDPDPNPPLPAGIPPSPAAGGSAPYAGTREEAQEKVRAAFRAVEKGRGAAWRQYLPHLLPLVLDGLPE